MFRHFLIAVLAVPLTATLPAAAAPSASAGKALAEENCAACHGATGNETNDGQTPRLAGQKPDYLIRQMTAFRSDALPSETMHDLAADLSDSQIADLAAWFASQRRTRAPSGKPVGNAAAGARLFVARVRGTPPCAACHAPEDFLSGRGGGMGYGMMGGGMGMGGMGRGGMGPMRTDPAITPILYAQNAPYLLTQLNDFASGHRKGSVMGPIAARLTPPERAALAAYLSAHAPASR